MGRDAQSPASWGDYDLLSFEMRIKFHRSPAACVLKTYYLRLFTCAARANDSIVAPAQPFAQVICQIVQVRVDLLYACFEQKSEACVQPVQQRRSIIASLPSERSLLPWLLKVKIVLRLTNAHPSHKPRPYPSPRSIR